MSSVLPLLSGPMERSHIDVNGFHPLSLSKDVSVPFMARVPVSKDHSERHGLQGSDFCLVTSSSYCHICEGTTSSLSHYHHWFNLTLLPHQLARPISMTSSNLSSIYQVIIENDCRGLLNAKALFDEGDQWRHNLRHRGVTEDSLRRAPYQCSFFVQSVCKASEYLRDTRQRIAVVTRGLSTDQSAFLEGARLYLRFSTFLIYTHT
jgi:hypothetical protein